MTRDAIYELLIQRITPMVRGTLTCEEITDLDGVLWQIATMLAEASEIKAPAS